MATDLMLIPTRDFARKVSPYNHKTTDGFKHPIQSPLILRGKTAQAWPSGFPDSA
jgi:hypothetical protein